MDYEIGDEIFILNGKSEVISAKITRNERDFLTLNSDEITLPLCLSISTVERMWSKIKEMRLNSA